MTGITTRRQYRQDDELYDLIGRLAGRLGTTRTTTVELAVRELNEVLAGPQAATMEPWLAEQARTIDGVRRAAITDAATEARQEKAAARRRRMKAAV